ncbi:TPA: restriction endonuclease subunit S [Klebsiella pneumoniae]|uniref:restriction endonuclease subunit S n=1 Tax=Klebsiella TaxID=570 RepID=UPI000D74926C|nr:restriction endonuclease subunit S [Klebsiella pneumoniae]EIW8678105.1 restriction endonuclease subunit S [Klebsiella pneumoniae]ELA0514593.1 restriction endonuclease subunit S [Klebsiella pneumoniae]ELA2428208.1 restriction endonuclease subunit S [Klebsiella pneumoniae]ELA2492113.1 restriction endonuclease subunit S [Klebsiella pneumoniae]ELA2513030.1 restriction endonuclease subunit S [Klebsiella pneumoniae]
MSGLSYLEKLLDGAEVEWRTLDSVGQFLRGKRFVKSDLISEGVPCIHYGEMYTHYGISAEETKSFLDEGVAEKLRVANHGDVIIVAAGETIEDIGNGTAWLGKNDVVFHDACFSFKSELNSKYVSYFLRTNLFKEQIKRGVSSGKISSINAKGLGMAEIPIPCPNNPEKSLAIQSEIVRVLDKFTALTAELTAELTMRKKQYNYYRDQLLSFDEGEVEWKTLGAIGKFTYGYAAKAQISGDARFVRITDINTNGKLSPFEPMFVDISAENEKYTLKKNDLLMARTGATFGKTMIFEEDYPAIYAGFLIKLSLDRDIIDPKYYWHFAQSDYFWEQANKLVSGGGQPQFNANALKQIKVPIPYPNEAGKSLSEQARIVSVLDKFDILASSITEGLPREIELRQKQYEYYRDLLFSVPKPEIASY